MRLIARGGVAALATFVATAVAVPAAPAAIRITRIYYDSPGKDTRSNASRNAEWVRLKNTGHTARQLRDWRLSDASRHVYRFDRFTLRAGRTVTIHTGNGHDTASDLFWGSGNYIWNNDTDTARLRRRDGGLVDSYHYENPNASSRPARPAGACVPRVRASGYHSLCVA